MEREVATAVCLGLLASAACAGDRASLSASLGHMSGQARELVYDPNGNKLSELVWDMDHALALKGGLVVRVMDRLSVYGNATLGLAADSFMNNYDWVGAPPPAAPDLHSWHDDTALDHAYALDAGLAFALLEGEGQRVSVLGGFKYTDMKWTAYGGCYDYGVTEGCFADGQKVITYQLRLPAAYAGLGYSETIGNWSLALEGRAGMTFAGPEAEDDHWLRSTNFLDQFAPAPYLSATGKAAYGLNDQASLFASAAYDRFFDMRGETTTTRTDTGEVTRADYDSAGASLYTLNLAIGMDVKF